ncbi:MAG: alpha/beta fold hydrolase [Rhodospirillaceae bacterium]|nr:alpha/beta fold hydrolase [Rhodospirillaceae bacterium]
MTITTADGVQLPAILSYPASGLNPTGPVLIHLLDGPGVSAARAGEPARFVANALARRGYTSLTLEPRYARSYPFSRFDEGVTDVRAAVEMLSVRGFSSIVLTGHGLGSLLAVRYVAETDDARIKALAHFAPSPDLAAFWRAKLGSQKYAAFVETASKAVTEPGRGDFIDLGDGLIFTPASFLDWLGPTAKTSLTASISGVARPMFFAAGDKDISVPKGRLEQLKSLSLFAKQTELKAYAADHDFAGAHDALNSDVAKWLSKLGLVPAPKVLTTLVDATAADGTPLAGVLYAPATGSNPAKPAFLMIHGWTGDIMRSSSHWLGQRLAQKGYTAFALQVRSSGFRGVVGGKLEDTPQDIAAWVTFMAARGYRQLIAEGHSTGGLWISNYVSQTKDPRIKGVVYLAPMRDMPKHARLAMGEDRYARTVVEAEEAIRDGKGATTLIDARFPQPAYDEDPRQPMFLPLPGSGFTYYYADSFLSYWGPGARSVHTQRVADVKVPILALGGSRDPLTQGAHLIDFTEAAGKNAGYIFYGGRTGATNSFEGFEGRVVDDIVVWMDKTFK